MTAAQRLALAAAFERLQQRIAAQPEAPEQPVISRKSQRVVIKALGGSYRRRMSHIEE